jgi:hypothetical protein
MTNAPAPNAESWRSVKPISVLIGARRMYINCRSRKLRT